MSLIREVTAKTTIPLDMSLSHGQAVLMTSHRLVLIYVRL